MHDHKTLLDISYLFLTGLSAHKHNSESLDSLADNDPTGRTTYIKTCENLGVVPVSYFTRHITDPEIVMRYHGLGPQGARAMSRVLRVSTNFVLTNGE